MDNQNQHPTGSQHPIGILLETSMRKIREMVDVNTIIGTPITMPDGVTIIPVSKVSFGFTSGGSEFRSKNQKPEIPYNQFGGGAGAGVNISPMAFLVVKGDSVKVLGVEPAASSPLEKLIEAIPDAVNRIIELIKKDDADEKNEDSEAENG